MVNLRETVEGVILPIQAQPGARRNAILGEHAGRLKVAVTQPPEKGRANEAILELLAAALHLRPAQLQLVRGETSRQKEFLVRGLRSEDLARLLTSNPSG